MESVLAAAWISGLSEKSMWNVRVQVTDITWNGPFYFLQFSVCSKVKKAQGIIG